MLINCQLNLYDTDWKLRNSSSIFPLQFDCLHYLVLDNIVIYDDTLNQPRQTIVYCQRPRDKNDLSPILSLNNIQGKKFTFEELQSLNTTIQQLLSWSTPIDLIERYQIYLDNDTSQLISKGSDIFYNCTPPWFGTFCEYSFDIGFNYVDWRYC
ncbi:unnamed protein product [Rotaria sordida]|uniref:Uncharacterized protein n=1 Tax=Rotaria sordida TaxID=392033 RepID=A0A815VFH5_9BILA|nr:unnamed protein product [Rotaria sordida]CAF1528342.1 unnamed protein product [Rotaria sordida]